MYNGLLFIGDPHLTSRKPGRRTDDNHTLVVLDKIRQSLVIANQRNLFPVILGDLFSQSKESCHWMLTYLYRILRENALPGADKIICLAGNHDMRDTSLTDDTTLAMVAATGLLNVLSTIDPVVIDGLCVLYPVPSGFPLPQSVTTNGFPIIVLTHDDFAFGDSYPGAKPLAEIKGACMMVNGHMHKTERPIQMGETLCHNPGNITRVSIDTRDHVPAVWEWKPVYGNNMTRIALEYKEDVFDAIGKRIAPDIASITNDSEFTKLLVAERASEASRTEDGGMLSEDLHAIIENKKADFGSAAIAAAVEELIDQMLMEAASRNASAVVMPEETA